MELIGSPVALWESVQGFSISDTGKLFYTGVRGTLGFGRYSPVWVDREGASREIDPGWLLEGQAQRFSLAIAPEGGRLVVSSAGPDGVDLWIKELDSGPPYPAHYSGWGQCDLVAGRSVLALCVEP